MKKGLIWLLRGGIAATLILLMLSVWPSKIVEQTQSFEISKAGVVPATIRFSAPEEVFRGQQADFLVSLDMAAVLAHDDVNPVMIYRLELDGAEIVPAAVFQIPLAGVQHQEASWGVRLPQAGEYAGKWWVYVEYVSGAEVIDRQALFAKSFSVESQGILGMSVKGARWVSMIVILLGLGVEVCFSLRRRRAA